MFAGCSSIVLVGLATAADPPTAADVSVAGSEDAVTRFSLSATDPAGLPLTYTLDTSPLGSAGSVACTGARCTFTPAANWHGVAWFAYTASNGSATSNTARVTITVSPVNDRPTATSQSGLGVVEDIARTITLAGTDIDGDRLTFEVLRAPEHGTATLTGNVVLYTPASNYYGADSFTFRTFDGAAYSSFATVTLTVNGTPDPPTVTSSDVSLDEDTSVSFDLPASDPDGDSLRLTVYDATATSGGWTTDEGGGFLSIDGAEVTYTPAADFTGTDHFTLQASDGRYLSDFATVSFTVNPVNDAPVAYDQSGVTVAEDTTRTIVLTADDVDGDALTFTIVDHPDHGVARVTGDAVTYIPTAGYSGPDAFSFRARDGAAWSNTATVDITVRSGNDAPDAGDVSVATDEDTTVVFDLDATDADGDPLTISFGDAVAAGSTWTTTGEGHGTFTVSGTTVTYTPAADYHGPDTFTYSVSDGTHTSPAATVTVDVSPVNDAPVPVEAWARSAAGAEAHFVLQATDVDGDALTYTLITSPRYGTATLWNGDRVAYRPSTSTRRRTDWFTWVVSDGAATASSVARVDVRPDVAPFPLDTLAVDTTVSSSTTADGNLVLAFPSSHDGCATTWSAQPVVQGELSGAPVGTIGVIATHYDTLTCGFSGYLSEYSRIYVVRSLGPGAGYEVRLLDDGQNVQAAGLSLEDGSLLFTRVGTDTEIGGMVRYTPGADGDDTVVTVTEVNPLGSATDSSPWYDPESGTVLMMTAVMPETCGDAADDNCGVIAALDPAGGLLDKVDEDDGHHAWGSGGCVSIYGERYCASGPGSNASGADLEDLGACVVARLEGPDPAPASTGTVSTTLAIGDSFDPGDSGCSPVASLESSFINGGLVSDGVDLYAVALGSDTGDATTRVYRLDHDLTVLDTYEIDSEWSHTFTNGFHNSLLVSAEGRLYITGTVDAGGLPAYAVVEIDPADGNVTYLTTDPVAHDNLHGSGHLYVDAHGDEVIAYAVGETGVVTRLSDGATLATWTLGATGGDYVAPPVLLGDGDGVDDALMFVSTDNVVTIVPDSGLAEDVDAPWPGPRGGGPMRATID